MLINMNLTALTSIAAALVLVHIHYDVPIARALTDGEEVPSKYMVSDTAMILLVIKV